MKELSDYDKAFIVICGRFKHEYAKKSDCASNVANIKTFEVDVCNHVCAMFDDGFLYVYKEVNSIRDHATIKHVNTRHVSTEMIIHAFFDIAKDYDIVIGRNYPVKILSKGETLESLAIEYDMSLKP